MKNIFRPFFGGSLLFCLACAGCGFGSFRDGLSPNASRETAESDLRTSESRTLSSLAAIERSLGDFIKARRVVPKNLEELVPDFLAEIPEVDLGLPGYKPRSTVMRYPASIIADGQINGASLEDTGGWGYVFDGKQVIVFVDCVRKRMDGSFWYRARGVY